MNIEETLKERGARYGHFGNNAGISQHLKNYLRDYPDWTRLNFTQQEAIEVICQKISRIVSGDPNYKDNWHDIAGYAKLAEDSCIEEPKAVFTDVKITNSSTCITYCQDNEDSDITL